MIFALFTLPSVSRFFFLNMLIYSLRSAVRYEASKFLLRRDKPENDRACGGERARHVLSFKMILSEVNDLHRLIGIHI